MKLGLVLAFSAICVIGIHSSCLPLHNEDAKIWNGLIGSFIEDKDATLAKIKANNLPHALSKCAGSLDVDLGTALGVIGNPSCNAAIKTIFPNFSPPFNNDMTMKPNYAKIQKDLMSIYQKHSNSYYALVIALRNYFVTIPKSIHTDLGNLMHQNFANCIKTAIIPALFSRAIEGSCCDDMRLKFHEYTNKDLTSEYALEILFKVFDIPLTMIQGSTCGYSIVQSVIRNDLKTHTKAFVSTPNNQACIASNGKEFMMTSGSFHQYDNAIGCCAKSFDQFLGIIKEYPIVKKYVNENVFSPNSYWSPTQGQINNILSYISDQDIKNEVQSFLKNSRFHLANNFADQCIFTPNQCEYVSSKL